jgi:hypothetical protein
MTKTETKTAVLGQAKRLLTNISFAIDAAFEVAATYPAEDKAYVEEVLTGLRIDLADALVKAQ